MKITVKKVFIFQVHPAKLRQKNNGMTDTRKQNETAQGPLDLFPRGMENFQAMEQHFISVVNAGLMYNL
jgi:hypothetical protein